MWAVGTYDDRGVEHALPRAHAADRTVFLDESDHRCLGADLRSRVLGCLDEKRIEDDAPDAQPWRLEPRRNRRVGFETDVVDHEATAIERGCASCEQPVQDAQAPEAGHSRWVDHVGRGDLAREAGTIDEAHSHPTGGQGCGQRGAGAPGAHHDDVEVLVHEARPDANRQNFVMP